MGKKLEEIRKDNLENIKIGFFLEMKFYNDFILKNLKDYQSFLKDNKEFLSDCVFFNLISNIDNIASLFCSLTDISLSFLDNNEIYFKFHKDFY